MRCFLCNFTLDNIVRTYKGSIIWSNYYFILIFRMPASMADIGHFSMPMMSCRYRFHIHHYLFQDACLAGEFLGPWTPTICTQWHLGWFVSCILHWPAASSLFHRPIFQFCLVSIGKRVLNSFCIAVSSTVQQYVMPNLATIHFVFSPLYNVSRVYIFYSFRFNRLVFIKSHNNSPFL